MQAFYTHFQAKFSPFSLEEKYSNKKAQRKREKSYPFLRKTEIKFIGRDKQRAVIPYHHAKRNRSALQHEREIYRLENKRNYRP